MRLRPVSVLVGAILLGIAHPLLAQDPSAPPADVLPTHVGESFPSQLFVFMLATFIGLGVITRVSRLLHTPLMSITNAISAIAVVGSIIVVSNPEHPKYITMIGAVALFASMTNIVSGFLITDRMLKMFKQREPQKP
ncbi:MAG: NAD(P) transhydrogenase subunit alpha [bacterium]